MTHFSKGSARLDGVSPKTDKLATTLFSDALDMLAEGEPLNVLLVVEDIHGARASYTISDDDEKALISKAHNQVRELACQGGDDDINLNMPVRYAIAYMGAIETTQADGFKDALILEFGEKGYKSYSAYSYVKGRGHKFAWNDPSPAGEVEPLL
jgi:hypothetical protein